MDEEFDDCSGHCPQTSEIPVVKLVNLKLQATAACHHGFSSVQNRRLGMSRIRLARFLPNMFAEDTACKAVVP